MLVLCGLSAYLKQMKKYLDAKTNKRKAKLKNKKSFQDFNK